MPAVALTATAIHVPMRLTGSDAYIDEAQLKDKRWIMHVLPLLEEDNLTSEDTLVWAAYHACFKAASCRGSSCYMSITASF